MILINNNIVPLSFVTPGGSKVLHGIAIDLDEEVLKQLMLDDKLSVDHFRCVDSHSQQAIRKLFLWVLNQRLQQTLPDS
ncbi:hypothetical protein [Aurantivibrio plasticivorans]